MNVAVSMLYVILVANLQTSRCATIAVTPQGQLIRSDAPLAELMDQDTASGVSTRRSVLESTEATARAHSYESALQRESRPKALAVATVVLLIPITLAILQLLLAFRVASKLVGMWPVAPVKEESAPLPRVTLGGTTLQLKESKQEPVLEMLALSVMLLALACGIYFCIAWTALVPGPFLQQLSCNTTASADVSPMVAETLRSFCWAGARWEGVTRREAELLLSGLERSLAMDPGEGAVLEFGVGVGETTLWVSRFLDIYSQVSGEPRRAHHVYDPFKGPGFPKRDRMRDKLLNNVWRSWPGRVAQGIVKTRRWLFDFFLWSQGAKMPEVHEGYMVQVSERALPSKVAFALIDAESYPQTILPLKLVYKRLQAHGEVYVHGYRQQSCPGVHDAVKHFFKGNRGVYSWGHGSQGVSWAVAGPRLAYNISHVHMAKLGWKWMARTVRAPDLKAVLSVQFQSKKRLEGRVRWFDKDKGFGKILPLDPRPGEDAPEEIFVHKKQIEDGTEGDNYAALAPGALVSFEMTTQDDGKPCAGNVRVQGFAKIVQNGLTIAAGAALSAREAKLRQLLLQGLKAGVFQEKGHKKALMEDGFLEGTSREVGMLGSTVKSAAMAVYAVMDGHAGISCSNFVALNLERNILDSLRDQRKRDANAEQVLKSALLAGFKVTEHTFHQYANKLEGGAGRTWATSGSTCCAACLAGPDEEGRLRLLIANVGDSRAILGKKDGFAVRLSVDHRPDNTAEKRRVEQQGGTVAPFGGAHRVILKSRGQVAAGLSVTRSFGDVDFKVPVEVITAVPELSAFAIDPEEDVMLILVTDGITGSVSDVEAVRLASGPLREGGADAPERAARALVEAAHTREPSDDKTAMVIWFGGSPDERMGATSGSTDAVEDLFGGREDATGKPETEQATQAVPQAATEDDMFADGADPVEMALLDDIFGAYAKEMGVDMASESGAKRKSVEEAKDLKRKGLSNKVAKKVVSLHPGIGLECQWKMMGRFNENLFRVDVRSLTREELLELNKQPDQRPARPRLPTAFTQTGVAGVVETAPNPDSPRFQAMMSSMPDHMKEMVFSPRDELDLQKHMVTGATKDKELLESILRKLLYFKDVDQETLQKLIAAMEVFRFPDGTQVSRQGSYRGSHFFIVSKGTLVVLRNGETKSEITKGAAFGENVILMSGAQDATIQAKGEVEVYGMHGVRSRALLAEQYQRERGQASSAVNEALSCDSCWLLRKLTPYQMQCLFDKVNVLGFENGATILEAGHKETPDLHIVLQGQVSLTAAGQEVSLVERMGVVGDGGLLCKEEALKAVACGAVQTLVLDRTLLEQMFGTNLEETVIRSRILDTLRQQEDLIHLRVDQLDGLASLCEVIDLQPGSTIERSSYRLGFSLVGQAEAALVDRDGNVRPPVQLSARGKVLYPEDADLDGDRSPVLRLRLAPTATQPVKLALWSGRPVAGFLEVVRRKKRVSSSPDISPMSTSSENRARSPSMRLAVLSDDKVGALRKVVVFRTLAPDQLHRLAEALEVKKMKPGQIVFNQGEKGQEFYIIHTGLLEVSIDGRKVRTLGMGDYVGERALLFDGPRTATVKVVEDCELWMMDLDDFNQAVQGPILEYMKARIGLQNTKIDLNSLTCLRVIGRGGFGVVKMVQSKTSDTRYALKCVSKKQAVEQKQQKALAHERNILAELDHPFIIKFVRSFNSPRHVYFLTELVTGGELLDALDALGLLQAPQAQFYSASIILALEFLHERRIAYLDLKGENCLIDQHGYLKIIDFGVAERITDGRIYAVKGTPLFMAPEVILGKGYTTSADLWSLGVCLFDFMVGSFPFGDDQAGNAEIFKAVLKAPLKFPKWLGVHEKDAKELMKALLCRDPAKRLGAGQRGYEELK
ncbi:for, partial [Symbiodinium sp. CCMP2456]